MREVLTVLELPFPTFSWSVYCLAEVGYMVAWLLEAFRCVCILSKAARSRELEGSASDPSADESNLL